MGIEGKQSRRMAPYEAAQTSAPWNGQAVVLGGGLAGLLAARVLADTFEEVMIIERHESPVAQQVLPQVLSDHARTQLDELFAGLSSELVANGASTAVDARLQFTQEFIHRHLSHRLNSFDGVVIQYGCDAVGLVSWGGRWVGVHVLPRSRSAAARTIPTDLVVDAMGAQSRLCRWVNDLWRIHVPNDQQMITHYASRLYQLRDGSLPAATTIDLWPARPYRAAVMAGRKRPACDDHRRSDQPSTRRRSVRSFAAQSPSPAGCGNHCRRSVGGAGDHVCLSQDSAPLRLRRPPAPECRRTWR
jgi:ribulose 1,5-bisphosphate synthetase/thiazole synthase